jgi:hypothetical protein
MNITFGLIELFVLLAVLIYTTVYYWRTANFMKYAAGKAFMTLLLTLDALVAYTTVARFVPPDIRRPIFEVLMLLFIGAVLYIQGVMRHERATERRRQRARYFEPQDPPKETAEQQGDNS